MGWEAWKPWLVQACKPGLVEALLSCSIARFFRRAAPSNGFSMLPMWIWGVTWTG